LLETAVAERDALLAERDAQLAEQHVDVVSLWETLSAEFPFGFSRA
jgi:hypothetical protein